MMGTPDGINKKEGWSLVGNWKKGYIKKRR